MSIDLGIYLMLKNLLFKKVLCHIILVYFTKLSYQIHGILQNNAY